MLQELQDKLFGYHDWDEDMESWKWDGNAEKKISFLEVLSFMMDLIMAIQEEYIHQDDYFKHYHTERDSIEREVRI